MKRFWYVHLIAQPRQDDYRSGYFPRKFYYRADAKRLQAEVQAKGGVARVTNSEERPEHDDK